MAQGKVLIVDDDEEFCDELRDILEGVGYETDAVFEGERVAQALEGQTCQTVILDLKLPGLSGYEVLKSLKSQHPHTKVIVLTGNPVSNELLQEELVTGASAEDASALALADGILNKPCDADELLAMIGRLSSG